MIAPNNVVLITRSKVPNFQIRLDLRTNVVGLSLEHDLPAEGCRSRLADWTDVEQEVVLAPIVPVDLAGKGGIAAEAEILVEVDVIVASIRAKITAWMSQPPTPIHSKLIVIEVPRVLGANHWKGS